MGDSARENSSLPVKSARDFFSSTRGKCRENQKKNAPEAFFSTVKKTEKMGKNSLYGHFWFSRKNTMGYGGSGVTFVISVIFLILRLKFVAY